MSSTENLPKFTVTVEINTAALQGTFKMGCVARRNSEMRALEKQCDDDGTGMKGLLKKVVTDVSDISIPAIRFPEFKSTEEAIDALTDWPGIELAMHRKFFSGMWEEQRKN
ncbi:hypothetical protein ACFJGW_00580 [Burkholderiaceae bacterium UC74_6]